MHASRGRRRLSTSGVSGSSVSAGNAVGDRGRLMYGRMVLQSEAEDGRSCARTDEARVLHVPRRMDRWER